MAYMQVKDILKHIQTLRGRVLDEALWEQATTRDEQLATFLDQARDHEAKMGAMLDEQIEQTPSGVLETWIQYSEDSTLQQEIEDLEKLITSDDIGNKAVGYLIAIDQRIVELYKSCAAQTHGENLQSFFNEILLMEEQKARAKGWNFTEATDITDI